MSTNNSNLVSHRLSSKLILRNLKLRLMIGVNFCRWCSVKCHTVMAKVITASYNPFYKSLILIRVVSSVNKNEYRKLLFCTSFSSDELMVEGFSETKAVFK